MFQLGGVNVYQETHTRLQVEEVFAVESVEEAIDNLAGRSEPWAQMALQNIGKLDTQIVSTNCGTYQAEKNCKNQCVSEPPTSAFSPWFLRAIITSELEGDTRASETGGGHGLGELPRRRVFRQRTPLRVARLRDGDASA